MSRNSLTIYVCFIIAALFVVTAAAGFTKPSINKTVVLQIQKFVKQ